MEPQVWRSTNLATALQAAWPGPHTASPPHPARAPPQAGQPRAPHAPVRAGTRATQRVATMRVQPRTSILSRPAMTSCPAYVSAMVDTRPLASRPMAHSVLNCGRWEQGSRGERETAPPNRSLPMQAASCMPHKTRRIHLPGPTCCPNSWASRSPADSRPMGSVVPAKPCEWRSGGRAGGQGGDGQGRASKQSRAGPYTYPARQHPKTEGACSAEKHLLYSPGQTRR